MKFILHYYDNMIDMEAHPTDEDRFLYSNMRNCYKGNKHGHGMIQVDNYDNEKDLLEMCDKISDLIYEYIDKKEIKDGKKRKK